MSHMMPAGLNPSRMANRIQGQVQRRLRDVGVGRLPVPTSPSRPQLKRDRAPQPTVGQPSRLNLPEPQSRPTGGGQQAAIEAIKRDPAIRSAFDTWRNLTTEQKLAIGKRISNIQGQAMGFKPVSHLSRDASLAKPGQSGTYGRWSSQGGIAISDAALADPARFLNTVAHEQAHEMQWQRGIRPSPNHANGTDAVYDIGNAFERGVFGTASLNGTR